MVYREKWVEDWERLAHACAQTGGPKFVPADEETVAALRACYDLPEHFEEILRIGYPESPIQVGHRRMFPSVKALLTLPHEVPGWPRVCVPIDNSGYDDVLLVRRGIEGIARLFVDDGEPGEPRTEDTWVSFGDLLEAILVLYTEISKHSVTAGTKGECGLYREWLPPDVVRGIALRVGVFRADNALTFFGLARTATDVYREVRSSAIEAAVMACIGGVCAVVLSVGGVAGPRSMPLWA